MEVQSLSGEMRFSRPTRRSRDQLASWASPDRFGRLSKEEIADFEPDRRTALSELVYSTASEFYDLIPLDHARVIGLISTLLGVPGTDLANLHVLADGETDLALLTELPASELATADQLRTLNILRALDRAGRGEFKLALDKYSRTVEPIVPVGSYGSGLAAAPLARGMGLGRVAMQRFLDLADGSPAQLHIHRGNRLVIALHRKLGFEFVSDAPFVYRAMIRAAPSSGNRS